MKKAFFLMLAGLLIIAVVSCAPKADNTAVTNRDRAPDTTPISSNKDSSKTDKNIPNFAMLYGDWDVISDSQIIGYLTFHDKIIDKAELRSAIDKAELRESRSDGSENSRSLLFYSFDANMNQLFLLDGWPEKMALKWNDNNSITLSSEDEYEDVQIPLTRTSDIPSALQTVIDEWQSTLENDSKIPKNGNSIAGFWQTEHMDLPVVLAFTEDGLYEVFYFVDGSLYDDILNGWVYEEQNEEDSGYAGYIFDEEANTIYLYDTASTQFIEEINWNGADEFTMNREGTLYRRKTNAAFEPGIKRAELWPVGGNVKHFQQINGDFDFPYDG
jgi:hypothetical protein